MVGPDEVCIGGAVDLARLFERLWVAKAAQKQKPF